MSVTTAVQSALSTNTAYANNVDVILKPRCFPVILNELADSKRTAHVPCPRTSRVKEGNLKRYWLHFSLKRITEPVMLRRALRDFHTSTAT